MTDPVVAEDRLARKYRQPKGVEQFGIEPVPENLKTVRWYDLFVIVINFLINPGMILIGGLAVAAGLSFWAAVTAVVSGIVVAFTAYLVMATIGVDYGLPGQVATRMTYGIRGAKWIPSVLRTVASVVQFAFQTIAGALAISAVLSALFGVEFSLVLVSLVFAVLQVAVAVVGYDSLRKLSRAAFPLKVAILAYICYLLMTHDAPGFAPGEVFSYGGTVGWQWAVFALWLNAVAGAWLSMITDAADFCRYSNSRPDMWVGTMSAAVIGAVFSAFIGAYGAAATRGEVANTFEVIPQISSSVLTLSLVLIVVLLDNWTINVLNLYTGGLSVSNIFSNLGRFWTTLMVSVAGVALSLFPQMIDFFAQVGGALGAFFAPIAGVLIADYLLVKRSRIDVLALFDREGPYWYVGGFNPVAVAWTAAGVVIYYFTPVVVLQSAAIVVVTAVGYYVTLRIAAPRSPALAKAARPGRQRDEVSAEDAVSLT